MRTLQLTHEQINLLCQALGIAEKQFISIHKTIVDTTINVRENYGMSAEQSINGNFYNKMSCELADLNSSIQNGEFDK